jgi:hypothetical protein
VPYPLVPQERIFIDARHSDAFDMHGQAFHFEAKIMRLFPQGEENDYACGSELMLNREKYIEAVNYVYGDSERWLELWDKKSASKGVPKMLWYFFVTGLKGTVQSAIMLFAQVSTPILRLLKGINFRLLSDLRRISLHSLFGQHTEELQVDTGRGLLLVKSTPLDAHANRRKIPRIGRGPAKSPIAANAEMNVRNNQLSSKVPNRRKAPRLVPTPAIAAGAGGDMQPGKMVNRRKIPRISPRPAPKADVGMGARPDKMVNRRRIPRINPKPTVGTVTEEGAGNNVKSDKKKK